MIWPVTQIRFDPLLPWWAIAALAALAVLAGGFALWRGLRGWAWRGLAGLAAALALAGPALETGSRSGLSDIVILIDDRSASQSLPDRTAQTDGAVEAMTRRIAALPDTELRRVTVGDNDDGTLLATELARAVAAEPETRLAGVIAVTDGRLHDPAMLPATVPAPVHVLLTGRPQDWDRRLVIEEAPAFGLIDQEVTIRLRVEDQGAVPPEAQAGSVSLRLSVDGGAEQTLAVPLNTAVTLPLMLDHAGLNVVQIGFDAPAVDAPDRAELTDRNNATALSINGVRDRLRVLLVSGEPHAGERTWRNLLKSDAAVDLIHFTILRPPDKSDGVPVTELSLIAFPTQELFMERITDFDLIIFDRYSVRGILPPDYYLNIARYVEGGGAILVSAGPEMAGVESLYLSPLGQILPARPTGQVLEEPFLPRLTDDGRRHPVTAGLPGGNGENEGGEGDDPTWGRWLRMATVTPDPGAQVAMTGIDDQPLLILDRVGEGRVALLTSDQVWLWGRGFEGGGPQLELLRRIAHWSMKEPELEEEALLADVSGDLSVRLTRRTMADSAGPLVLTLPDGAMQQIPLVPAGPGRFVADWTAPGPGLYRLADGDLRRVLALGPAAPREFEQTVADAGALAPLVADTGGGVVRLSDGVPDLRTVAPGRNAHGGAALGDWIAVTPRAAATVTGLERRPVLPGWAWLLLISGLILAGWLREGRWRRGGGAASGTTAGTAPGAGPG